VGAAALVATVTGQAIEETTDGRLQLVAGTAPDRVISTVDPEARHGHTSAAHGLDGDTAMRHRSRQRAHHGRGGVVRDGR
jgi:hypothetical protein